MSTYVAVIYSLCFCLLGGGIDKLVTGRTAGSGRVLSSECNLLHCCRHSGPVRVNLSFCNKSLWKCAFLLEWHPICAYLPTLSGPHL